MHDLSKGTSNATSFDIHNYYSLVDPSAADYVNLDKVKQENQNKTYIIQRENTDQINLKDDVATNSSNGTAAKVE